ncbi:MAG: hypothetical protein IJH34_18060 [Romboutsia sp.]|nr:hypothetical protein [Romboutsia sp.]
MKVVDKLNSKDNKSNRSEYKAKLAEENYNCVYHVARSFSNTGLSYDELLSVAIVGYAKDLDNY